MTRHDLMGLRDAVSRDVTLMCSKDCRATYKGRADKPPTGWQTWKDGRSTGFARGEVRCPEHAEPAAELSP